MLDRDKFASAFARFVGVPLLVDKDVIVADRRGRCRWQGWRC